MSVVKMLPIVLFLSAIQGNPICLGVLHVLSEKTGKMASSFRELRREIENALGGREISGLTLVPLLRRMQGAGTIKELSGGCFWLTPFGEVALEAYKNYESAIKKGLKAIGDPKYVRIDFSGATPHIVCPDCGMGSFGWNGIQPKEEVSCEGCGQKMRLVE